MWAYSAASHHPIGKDILLIVNYNHPYYESIPFLKDLYHPYFPHIIFSGPKTFSHHIHPQVELCDHDRGYYAYKALAPIMKKYPNYAGYLWINDDCVINPWNFARFDTTKIWCLPNNVVKLAPSERKGWVWWQKAIGYQAIKKVYAKLSPKHRATLLKSCGQNAISAGAAEVVYIPAKHKVDVIKLCELFAHENSFIEIAFPTLCCCLDEKKNWEILDGLWLEGDPHTIIKYTKKIDYFHPIKFSLKNNQKFIRTQFQDNPKKGS